MLKSRSSGGRLVRSNPRQNTRSVPKPRSMHAGGTIKSTPRKMRGGGTSVRSKLGVSYGPPGGGSFVGPIGTQPKGINMGVQHQAWYQCTGAVGGDWEYECCPPGHSNCEGSQCEGDISWANTCNGMLGQGRTVYAPA
jgi:hypothetical protein